MENREDRIAELSAYGTRGELSRDEHNELQRLIALEKAPFAGRKRGERAAQGLVPPFHPKGESHKKYRS